MSASAGRTFQPGSPFISEATPPQHLARLEYSVDLKSVTLTQFLVLVLCNISPVLMQLHLDVVLRAVPDLHVSQKCHRNDSLKPVLTPTHHVRSCAHTSAAKLPMREIFISACTNYLSNSKYSKNNDKHNV